MKKKLFAIYFIDGRERKHVAAVYAATDEEALQMVTAYQAEYEGFLKAPTAENVVEINPSEVQILWHQDYD